MNRSVYPLLVSSVAMLLLSSCGGSHTAANTNVDVQHGKQTGISITALTGMNGALANGAATAYYFQDKGTIIGIQLNIAAAKEGNHYAAWAEDESLNKKISLGTLDNAFNDVRHSVRFDSGSDLQSYTNITVTLESNSGKTNRGTAVAEGILKATEP